jgi:hypothetical protein
LRANEIIRSTPFHQVCERHRIIHEAASLLYVSALFQASSYSDASIKLAIKTLDSTLLISAAPKHKDFIHDCISFLHSKSSKESISTLWPSMSSHVSTSTANDPLQYPTIVDYEGSIPLHKFIMEHLRPSVPLIIRDGAKDWPAVSKWKTEHYLPSCLSHRWVSHWNLHPRSYRMPI